MNNFRLSGTLTGVAGLYGISILTMLLADVFLARSLTRSEFGEYMLVRNSLPLVSVLVLLGVDQALTRRYAESRGEGLTAHVIKTRAPLAVAVAAGTSLLLSRALATSLLAAVVAGLAGIIVAFSDLVAAQLRGRGLYQSSAITQQGYRLVWGLIILAVVLVVPNGARLTATLLALPLAAALVTGFGLCRARPFAEDRLSDFDGAAVLGLSFGTSMLSLMLLDWADQALLARTTGLDTAGEYAAERLVAVYPLLSMASIAGFLLMPELVRRSSSITFHAMRRWAMLVLTACIVLASAWSIAAIWLFPHVMTGTYSPTVIVGLSAVGALRLFYLLPSSLLGAFGSTQLILKVSAVAMVAPVCLVVIYLLLLARLPGQQAMVAALVASTIIRVVVAVSGAHLALTQRGTL